MTKTRDLANLIADSKVGPSEIDTTGTYQVNSLGVGMAADPSVKLTVNGAIGPTNGSASAPTHTFYSDPDTGMFRTAANTLGFSSGGTEYVQLGSFGVAADQFTNKTAGGDVTIDAAGDIILDADGKQIIFADGGTQFGQISTNTTPADMAIKSLISDKDIIFQGIDGSSTINALTLDMSEAGVAKFNVGGVFNESGADSDFRVESDGNTHALFVDAGNNRIGIGTPSPSTFMHAQSSGDIQFRFETTSDSTASIQYKNGNNQWSAGIDNLEQFFVYDSTNAHSALTFIPLNEVVFNQNSKDVDFRVESDGNTHALFVDAGNNRVGFGLSNPAQSFAVQFATADRVGTFYDTGTNGNSMYNGAAVLGVSRSSNGSTSLNGPIFEVGRDNGLNATYNVSHSFLTVRSDATVINEDSQDYDFRVESNNTTHMLYVDSDQNEVGINTSTPGSTLEVNGNFRPTYYYPHSPTSQTSSNNNNYWKLGNIHLSGPYGAEITMHGAKPGYSSGGPNVGKLTILLRGGTNASLLDAVFYAEGDTSSVPCQSVRYVPNGNYDFEIYLQLGNYTSTSHTVVTGGSWTESVVNTGSTSAPANSIGIPAQRALWLGPNEVLSQTTTQTTINETGNDHDFRVESNNDTHALFVDGATGNVYGSKSASSMTTAGWGLARNGGSEFVSQGNNITPVKIASADDAYIALMQFYTAGGTQAGYILGNGSALSLVSNSDYRLKENVVDLTGATERLKQLPVHRFNFINNPSETVDGFLAHEVQSVVPEAAHGAKDAVDDDGNAVMQGIDQSKLVPLLVATIKELETRITTLENA